MLRDHFIEETPFSTRSTSGSPTACQLRRAGGRSEGRRESATRTRTPRAAGLLAQAAPALLGGARGRAARRALALLVRDVWPTTRPSPTALSCRARHLRRSLARPSTSAASGWSARERAAPSPPSRSPSRRPAPTCRPSGRRPRARATATASTARSVSSRTRASPTSTPSSRARARARTGARASRPSSSARACPASASRRAPL